MALQIEQLADGSRGMGRLRVVVGGAFAERSFERGETLLCVPEEREGALLILAPVGFGRPRLARRRGSRLVGEQGETLLAARWRVLGQLYAVLRPVAPAPVLFGQLALFAA